MHCIDFRFVWDISIKTSSSKQAAVYCRCIRPLKLVERNYFVQMRLIYARIWHRVYSFAYWFVDCRTPRRSTGVAFGYCIPSTFPLSIERLVMWLQPRMLLLRFTPSFTVSSHHHTPTPSIVERCEVTAHRAYLASKKFSTDGRGRRTDGAGTKTRHLIFSYGRGLYSFYFSLNLVTGNNICEPNVFKKNVFRKRRKT